MLFKHFNFFHKNIMIGNPSPEEENIIKDIKNIFREKRN